MNLRDKNLYYVGGVVRDEILGIPSFDTDYCYEGNAIEFSKSFNVIKKNPDFGTVRIIVDNKEIDIASTREETYPREGHLPIVKRIGCPLKDDLKRRDFTINALAKNTLTGEITDYFNGLGDIKEKQLRVLHNNSFREDPSRIIRGLKFSVRFNFSLDKHTEDLQTEYLNNINYDMSYHRLKKELKETFDLNKQEAYDIFVKKNIYKLLGKNQEIPTIKGEAESLIKEFGSEHKWLVFLGLFNLENFELTSEEAEIISGFNRIKNVHASGDFETYKMFNSVSKESVMLYALSVNYDSAYNYLKNLQNIKIQTNGETLKSLGIPAGRVYKEIFDYLLEKKLKYRDLTLDDEIKLVREKYV